MPANSDPLAVAYDGEYIWVALGNGNVTKVLQSTGSVIDTAASGGAATYFLAFDGGYVWASLPDPVAGVYSIAKM
jgi:DNA-binding beta-propeller fold protein YncE